MDKTLFNPNYAIEILPDGFDASTALSTTYDLMQLIILRPFDWAQGKLAQHSVALNHSTTDFFCCFVKIYNYKIYAPNA
jgi:hypothetical protein